MSARTVASSAAPRATPRAAPRANALAASLDPVAAPPEERPRAAVAAVEQGATTFDRVRDAAAGCQACDLWARATQTVFGSGPVPARLMLVGEQPGDKEDLAGEPFVGPACRLLDRALQDAGKLHHLRHQRGEALQARAARQAATAQAAQHL
jgi:Uracil DNA glycosylase superfamily